jgi:anthranilate 1,2-dioxygenase small subunit
MDEIMLRLELLALQDRYVATIDNDRLEYWPKLFTKDCLYQIISLSSSHMFTKCSVLSSHLEVA